jgi:hypothetical protein
MWIFLAKMTNIKSLNQESSLSLQKIKGKIRNGERIGKRILI